MYSHVLSSSVDRGFKRQISRLFARSFSPDSMTRPRAYVTNDVLFGRVSVMFLCSCNFSTASRFRTLLSRFPCSVKTPLWTSCSATQKRWARSDQRQISPAALAEILHHGMENLAFYTSLRWKMIILPILATSLIQFLIKMLGECTFWA